MKDKCPDCSKTIDLKVSTENILFYSQKCPHCDNEHTAVIRNFRLHNGQITGELVKTQMTGQLDIKKEKNNHG
jgi:hypothetical protein